jgi:signal transduction histidine kinase
MVSLFDLREIVTDVVLMLGVKARKNDIKLQVKLDEQPLMLKGDSIHIWQILMNVLLNAIQAIPRGGRIWIDARATDSSIRLMVRDEGEGISRERLSRIFDSFYTTKTNGSGLGLAIVKRIAEENKWTIDLKSEEGKGTEFVLTLPLSADNRPATATHQRFEQS